jgi:hypothetical protein
VRQVLTNATYLGRRVGVAAILTTEFTRELNLLKDGNEFMLVTVVKFSWPNGSTFDIKDEIATIAVVGEESFAKLKTGITKSKIL